MKEYCLAEYCLGDTALAYLLTPEKEFMTDQGNHCVKLQLSEREGFIWVTNEVQVMVYSQEPLMQLYH